MFNKSYILLFFILEIIVIISADESKTISVNIKSGIINGKTETFDGKEVNQFLGIPYAEKPLGDLRFKKPLPINQWSEPIEATNWPNPCLQIGILPQYSRNKNFSEDCLYLNIWSPDISGSDNDLKAVMFWIHGGSFALGSTSEKYYSGEILSIKGDVVVVTINYRLGTFGFLYTGTDDAPANVGFWDQVLALEWVNDNIKYFGGDPNRITIFGESAGSWATSLHVLSPISRNLYQNAIMMSGAAINMLASSEPENNIKRWLSAAKSIGCGDNENTFTPKIIECLRNAEPEKLVTLVDLSEIPSENIGWLSLVVVDGIFLPENPLNMLQKGDYKKNINLLIGTVSDEGSYILNFAIDPIKYDSINPANLTYNEAYNELIKLSSNLLSKTPINGNDVAKLYFTGLSDKNCFNLLRRTIGIAIGDYLLGCPTIQFAKTLYKNDRKSNVYQYYYNSKLGAEKLVCAKWMGTCHADDIWPVFGMPFTEFDGHLDREREISAQFIDFISTFAKTGKPSAQNGVDWPKYYTINDNIITPYYEITNEPKRNTNFGNGLKINECEYLWKPYIDQNLNNYV